MKTIVIFALICLSGTFATNLKMSMTSMLALREKANDAIEAGLDVIRGLKQQNVDDQSVADEINRTKEKELGAQIADMTYIADTNKGNGDAATEHRKYLENEIDVTTQYLMWIVKRRVELKRKRTELSEQRCVANMNFIKSLKATDEALQVVKLLRADVQDIVEEKTGIKVAALSQIKNAGERLGAYSKLFNDQAVTDFMDLSQEAVDQESLQHDENADDNDRGVIQLDTADDNSEGRDIAHRFIDMIDRLHDHLVESMDDLEKNEIQAAWDLSQWLQDSEEEMAHLDEDQVAKTTYSDKLQIAIIGAKAHEDRVWETYFASAEALNDATADREIIREKYIEEKQRRDEENLILEECIQLYIKQVSVLDAKIVAGVDDIADDGVANQSQGDYNADRVDALAATF